MAESAHTKELIVFLRSQLRRVSQRWKPIWQTRLAARRKCTGPNKRQKYEYQCAKCSKWFPAGKIQVDHLIPVGSLKTLDDLAGYTERLFCAQAGLQVLCLTCHKSKTKAP